MCNLECCRSASDAMRQKVAIWQCDMVRYSKRVEFIVETPLFNAIESAATLRLITPNVSTEPKAIPRLSCPPIFSYQMSHIHGSPCNWLKRAPNHPVTPATSLSDQNVIPWSLCGSLSEAGTVTSRFLVTMPQLVLPRPLRGCQAQHSALPGPGHCLII